LRSIRYPLPLAFHARIPTVRVPYGVPIDVSIMRSGNRIEVRARLFIGDRITSLSEILMVAGMALFQLMLDASSEHFSLNNARIWDIIEMEEEHRQAWRRPMHVEHFRAIGLVRLALEAGCRTMREICEYTGLLHTEVRSALKEIEREMEKVEEGDN